MNRDDAAVVTASNSIARAANLPQAASAAVHDCEKSLTLTFRYCENSSSRQTR
jgi:hypothetical protein